jgi:hypothetical protein
VLILEDGSAGYNVHVLVPAEVHRTLQPGQEVVLKDGKLQQKAAIHRLHPASSRGSSLMEIEIFVQSPPFGLASGASLSTELIVSSVTGLVVPERAVLSQDTGSWVFVVDGHNHIRPRQVEILARSSGRVAVKGQLQSGQEVAVGALSELMRLSPGLVAQSAGDGQS